MITGNGVYPKKVDVTNCDKEPIHIIGKSQAHGVILACDINTLIISQCSENSGAVIGYEAENLKGKHLSCFFPEELISKLKHFENEKVLLPEITIENKRFLVISHSSEESLILDIEPFGEGLDPVIFQDQLTRIMNELSASRDIEDMGKRAASLVKSLFGYDRVMLYRFDEEWNGEVIAEEREQHLESWLGLHYPATDIPKPSRDLFLKQGVRIISDVNYKPASLIPEISPLNGKPLDLSRSELRAVSPIHIEYLQNMKVGASLTAAIVLNGKLWGLLACHHYSAKFLNYHQRQSVKFLTQVFTNRLAVKTTGVFIEEMDRAEKIRKKLTQKMAATGEIISALTQQDPLFTDLIESSGGAVFFEGDLYLTGKTPSKEQVLELISEVLNNKEDLFHTKNLQEIYSKASEYKDIASGVLSVKIGDKKDNFLIWFREETSQTVDWGGNPEKKELVEGGVRYLSPRKSFEKWTQKVSGIANPWREYDFEAVTSLQEAITYQIVLQQKEEIRKLNERLTAVNKELKSFSYSVSHDLRAPLRGINSFAKILLEEQGEVLNQEGKRVLNIIINSAEEMNNLIHDLLRYASLGQEGLEKKPVDLSKLIGEILETINVKEEYPGAEVKIEKNLPIVNGDRRLIYQLISNILNNALKYSSKVEAPKVEIGFTEYPDPVFFIKDNGIGFDPKLKEKIFGVFSRLVGEEYSGSGIGLAIANKVVEKHQGKIWVETEKGKGSAFYFTLSA